MRRPRELSRVADAALWAAPIVLFVAVYHDAINAWWMADDAALLLSVIRHGTLAHFFRPNVELDIAASNLTPWLYASYGIDFAVGALQPRVAYLHHLAVWIATLVALTLLLRRWLGAAITALVVAWFVLVVPSGIVVQLLCTRHYVEGLLFALIAVLAYRRYHDGAGRRYLWLSAAFYAWAMTAKEIYVPLGPLIVVHAAVYGPSARPFASRLARGCATLWPYLALAAAYVLWRGYMLGYDRLFAGYDDPASRLPAAKLATFPAIWKDAFLWTRWHWVLWVVCLGSAVVAWRVFRAPLPGRRAIAFAAIVATAILLPIVPVMGYIAVNPHYLFVPALAFVTLAGWAVAQSFAVAAEPRAGARYAAHYARLAKCGQIGIVAIALALVGAEYRAESARSWLWKSRDYVDQHRVEGEYELYAPERTLVVDALGPRWHHQGLQSIRREWLHLPDGPLACSGDDCRTLAARFTGERDACRRYASAPPRLETVDCAGAAPGSAVVRVAP